MDTQMVLGADTAVADFVVEASAVPGDGTGVLTDDDLDGFDDPGDLDGPAGDDGVDDDDDVGDDVLEDPALNHE